MNNKELIKKLQAIYENSTLGDIPLIIKELEDSDNKVIKLIEKAISEEKADLEHFNGDFIRQENSIVEEDSNEELSDIVDGWELDQFCDSAYQVGRIRSLEWLLNKVKEVK